MSAPKLKFQSRQVELGGVVYNPVKVTDGASALSALLAITMNHTAEVFHSVLDGISEHYKIDKAEMMEVIMAHPSYKNIQTPTIINDLCYFDPAVVAVATAAATSAPAPTAPAKPKAFKIRKAKPMEEEPSS
jgi:hypothetical protein